MIGKFLPIDKWARIMKMISSNGGIIKSLEKMWRNDTLKDGRYVGTDSFGNKYYENSYYMIGRSRWVEFNPAVGWQYDASQVTAEWYGWLHYKTDRLPGEDCAKAEVLNCPWTKRWLLPYSENESGKEKAYYPYSTCTPHIHVWNGDELYEREPGMFNDINTRRTVLRVRAGRKGRRMSAQRLALLRCYGYAFTPHPAPRLTPVTLQTTVFRRGCANKYVYK